MRFRVRYYRDEWLILDELTGEVMRLNQSVVLLYERAVLLAARLSFNPADKLPEKWAPLR